MNKKLLKNLLLYLGSFLTLGIIVADQLLPLNKMLTIILLALGMIMVVVGASIKNPTKKKIK